MARQSPVQRHRAHSAGNTNDIAAPTDLQVPNVACGGIDPVYAYRQLIPWLGALMCHILLLLPLIALPVFSFFPLSVSVPVYGVVVALSAAVYWTAIQAMNQPVLNGAEGMIGNICDVVEIRDGKLFVRLHSEIWRAVPAEPRLNKGDRVKVVGVKNLTLHVQAMNLDANSLGVSPEPPPAKRIEWRLDRFLTWL